MVHYCVPRTNMILRCAAALHARPKWHTNTHTFVLKIRADAATTTSAPNAERQDDGGRRDRKSCVVVWGDNAARCVVARDGARRRVQAAERRAKLRLASSLAEARARVYRA